LRDDNNGKCLFSIVSSKQGEEQILAVELIFYDEQDVLEIVLFMFGIFAATLEILNI